MEKGEIPEVKLQANKDSKADKWELAINEAREESVGVFTDEHDPERKSQGRLACRRGRRMERGDRKTGDSVGWGGGGDAGGLKMVPVRKTENPSTFRLSSSDRSCSESRTNRQGKDRGAERSGGGGLQRRSRRMSGFMVMKRQIRWPNPGRGSEVRMRGWRR